MTTYRIDELADDDCRSHGGRIYHVIETLADGEERILLETHDADEACELLDELEENQV